MVDAKIPQNSRVIDFYTRRACRYSAAGSDHSTLLLLRFSRNYIFKGDLLNISETICPIDFKLGTHILNGIIYDVAYQFFEKRIIFFTLLSFVQ